VQRAAVAGAVAPGQLAKWESLIRGRIQNVLDDLPVDETFNWVECVSIELTGGMLATLFDIPQEDRRKLTDWSDVATASPDVGMSGGVYALNKFPEQFDKLKAGHSLIPNMVSEIIRWQTPLAHMRRLATQDVELGGKTIKKGDKVVMWYVSGNRGAGAGGI
jgi:cytochrome P450